MVRVMGEMSAVVAAPAYRGLGLNVPTHALVIMGWGAGVAIEFGGGDEPAIVVMRS